MKQVRPFSFDCTPTVPRILHELGCTIAISTYQAGKLILLSAPDPHTMAQLPRNFPKPMGIALDGKKMAVATLGEVNVFANEPIMAKNYPNQPNTYDALYLPRKTYFTSELDIHDIVYDNGELIAVNTMFSCLCKLDSNYSFTPFWQPHFISALKPGDRCHLNGLAMMDGKPKYVTALGTGDTPGSWRATKTSGGVLMDVEDNSIIAKNLPMPHSPRVYDGKIYVLFSATGQLATINPDDGSHRIVADLGGFVRGMKKHGQYLFIGLSKIRKTSKGFRDLPIAKKANQAGVLIFDMESNMVVGSIIYLASVDEIYDVQILPNMVRPGIVSPSKGVHKMAITSTFGSFWKIPKKLKKHP